MKVLIFFVLNFIYLITIGQCNIDVFTVKTFNEKKGSFCIEKDQKVKLGDLNPAFYFECISQVNKDREIELKFLLVQTVPNLNDKVEDLVGKIYFVKNKKRSLYFEKSSFKKVKIKDYQLHADDLQNQYDSLLFNKDKFTGILIYSEGLIPKFIKINNY